MLFRKQIYGSNPAYTLNQKLGIAMVIGHYSKRILETIFVHRFSLDTMPLFNIVKNSFHYWVLMGACCMYFLIRPDYTPPSWGSKTALAVMIGLFTLFELLNLKCHLILRNLRRPGTTERGVPKGWGFGLVSCANYLWEAMSWLTFAVQT
jgi:very-long-chain enoyl-CoA reductase